MEARNAHMHHNKQYRIYKKFNVVDMCGINTAGNVLAYFGKTRPACKIPGINPRW